MNTEQLNKEDFKKLIDLASQHLLQKSFELRMVESKKTLEQRALERIESEFYAISPLIK